jgi:hypothetical protein
VSLPSEEVMPRRISTWRILGIIVLVLVVSSAAVGIWIRIAIDRSWAEMERKVHALHAEALARSGLRPVLRGETEPGSAWTKYGEAIPMLRLAGIGRSTHGYDPSNEQAWEEALLKLHSPALVLLRNGVHRADGQRYRDWEHPESRESIFCLAALAGMEIESLKDGGKTRQSAERALDLIQFCCDAGRNGSREDSQDADWNREVAFVWLKDMILSGALSREDLTEVARELRAVEVSLPRLHEAFLNTAMEHGFVFLDVSSKGTLLYFTDGKVPWRHLYSERVMIAAAFDSLLRCMRRLAEADQKPWAESLEIQKRALTELASVDNPILKRYSAWVPNEGGSLLRTRREHLARIRLLRTAAHFKATGELIGMEDPFGGKLLSSKSVNRAKFWSVGEDGVDDGGSGDWSNKGKDIVLEVER